MQKNKKDQIKMPNLSDILKEMLGDPPMYDDGYNGRHPVDLSGLDTPITGYIMRTRNTERDDNGKACSKH